MAIETENLVVNHHTAETPTWIAVIRDGSAMLIESMDTVTIHEIVEGESKEALIAALAARGITVNEDVV